MTLTGSAVMAAGLGIACATLGCGRGDRRQDIGAGLDALLREAVERAGFERGVALHVDSPSAGIRWEGAAGLADPAAGEAMTVSHPVRIASNTKTYVAAAVLRLWEDGRIGLDDPIEGHLPPELLGPLAAGGYRPDAITVRHLLTHTSGLDDHGNDRYAGRVVADPRHRWTRAEQLAICVEEGRRQGEPGQVYRYSDTGYVLLGEILERATGSDFAGAVWELVDREALGLRETWFETLEPAPGGVPARAHQFYGDVDVTGFDPSFDLWGGGGIVATVGDLARFTRALFSGRVFRRQETLETMLTTLDGLRAPEGADGTGVPPGAYRMGVWVLERDGLSLYRHTGFWGTTATWIPRLDLVVAATVNSREAGELREALVDGAIDLVATRAAGAGPDDPPAGSPAAAAAPPRW